MTSPSKMLTPFFPLNDKAHVVNMPEIFYDNVEELGLVDLYAVDFAVEDEETWLSGPIERRPRVSSIMTKSISMGSLNPFDMNGMEAGDDDDAFVPRHSTPFSKANHKSRNYRANGDGVHLNGDKVPISPIRPDQAPSPPSDGVVDQTLTAKRANRTFDKEGEGGSPDENQPQLNRTHEKLPRTTGANGEKPRADLPRVPSAKHIGLPPPTSCRIAAGGGLKPPSRPPITTVRSPMNRTSSLGNLSSNQKLSVNAGPVARPANGGIPTTLRGPAVPLHGVQPKIGVPSRLVRPTVTTKLPAPTGNTATVPSGIPSRIPMPKALKK